MSAKQEAKYAAIRAAVSSAYGQYGTNDHWKGFGEGFDAGWKARGEADRAAVSSALTKRKVKTFDGLAVLTALDEEQQ